MDQQNKQVLKINFFVLLASSVLYFLSFLVPSVESGVNALILIVPVIIVNFFITMLLVFFLVKDTLGKRIFFTLISFGLGIFSPFILIVEMFVYINIDPQSWLMNL